MRARTHTFNCTRLFCIPVVVLFFLIPFTTFAATNITSNIASTTTWTSSGSPYVISSDITIDQGATLSIDPGVFVKIAQGVNISIAGKISPKGNATSSVIFTSISDDSDGNDTNGDATTTTAKSVSWGSINIRPGATADFLHTDLRYGGSMPRYRSGVSYYIAYIVPSQGVIQNGGKLSFTDSTIEHMAYSGGISSNGTLTFSHSAIHNVYTNTALSLSGTATISNSVFSLNESIQLFRADVTFSKTKVTNPVGVIDSRIYDGGGNIAPMILDWSGNIQDGTVFLAPPFINISSNVLVPSGATLTIAPNAIVKSYSSLDVYGTLISGSIATTTATTTLTSSADDSIGGNTNALSEISYTKNVKNQCGAYTYQPTWCAKALAQIAKDGGTIKFNPSTSEYGWGGIVAEKDSVVNLQNTDVRYAGDASGYDLTNVCSDGGSTSQIMCAGQILNKGGEVTVTSSIFTDALYNQITQDAGTTTISHSRFASSTRFAYVRGGYLSAKESSITDESIGIKNIGTNSVDARGNWWGDVSGPKNTDTNPSGKGPSVSTNVLFTPWLTSDPFAPKPKKPLVSNVLFIPGTEASRLYYRGALNIEHQVWEPDVYTDIPYLAMNADGTSKYKLYTKDIVGSLYGNNYIERKIARTRLSASGMQVYEKFKKFMNGLVASSTVKEWRAYPYDWRYGVRDIVNNGTLTEISGATLKRVYIENTLEQLASTSPTGKVTVIAHSNGGLVAKALIQKLSTDGKSNLVDKLIMIATPQWGTPEAIGVMLHGDGETQGLGLIMNSKDVRTVTKTMPGAYDLLPSPAYFAHINTPVVTFDTSGSLTKKFATAFGTAITSFPKLVDFLKNSAGLNSLIKTTDDLYKPITLSDSLINKAVATHAVLDTWTPQPAIAVTAIAGWGQDTVKTLAYTTRQKTVCDPLAVSVIGAFKPCNKVSYLEHAPVNTQDGDGTVVSPSAVGNVGQKLYFNISRFWNDKKENYIHRNITSASPIQKTIKDIITNTNPNIVQYITTFKPANGASPIKLRISSHSPVNLMVTNTNGKQSGVVHIPGTDFSGVKREIFGSSVQVFDSEEYINVPKSGTYNIVAKGYASGPTTLRIESISSNGIASTTETFANIPTTASSTVTFSLANGKPTAPVIDLTGAGKNTFIISTNTTSLSYVRYMKSAIKAMNLSRSEHFMLRARLSAIEMQLKDANRMSRELKNMYGKRYSRYQYFSKWRNKSIKFELRILTRYVKQQFALSVRLNKYKHSRHRWYWHNARPHITATQTETILGMINKLRTLI